MRPYIAWLAVVLAGCQVPGESASEQESVVISPSTFDFGTVQIGTRSAVHTVTITPSPLNQSDTVTAVTASCPDFAITATGLPADVFRVCEIITCTTVNQICPDPRLSAATDPRVVCQTTDLQTYSFSTAFVPTVAGPVSCVVTVSETDHRNGAANTKQVTLTGTGLAPPINADVQPASVAFGDVRRNTDSTQAQIVVRSTGGSALTVTSVAVSPGFTMTGPAGGYQLPPNAAQSYAVVCHPAGLGGMSGKLTVASDDPDQPSIDVALTCNGIDSNLDIAPSPAALPTTRVGEPIDATIALHNTGTAAMTLESVTLTGSGITLISGPPAGMTLGAATSTSVGVHFDAGAKGDAGATLIARYDGGQSRSTQISARALATSMALTPDGDVDFGPVCAGQTRTQEFTLIANDQGPFSLASLSDPGAPFSIAAPNLPAKVQGAGANQVKFQVTAAPVDAGPAAAQVVVHTDIPGGADHKLNLAVQGLPAGVTATPDMVDLGSNPINTTTIGQEVHLSNCNPQAIGFHDARIEGGDALNFAIVQQPSAAMLAPAGRASWLVVLQAHSVGIKQARFVVDHDGGTASILLQGEGLGELGKDSGGRGSYYACATGRPAALWPIGVALALVLRRRRR